MKTFGSVLGPLWFAVFSFGFSLCLLGCLFGFPLFRWLCHSLEFKYSYRGCLRLHAPCLLTTLRLPENSVDLHHFEVMFHGAAESETEFLLVKKWIESEHPGELYSEILGVAVCLAPDQSKENGTETACSLSSFLATPNLTGTWTVLVNLFAGPESFTPLEETAQTLPCCYHVACFGANRKAFLKKKLVLVSFSFCKFSKSFELPIFIHVLTHRIHSFSRQILYQSQTWVSFLSCRSRSAVYTRVLAARFRKHLGIFGRHLQGCNSKSDFQ